MAFSSSDLPQRGPWHGHTLGQSWVQIQFFISGELLNLPEPQLPLLGNEVGWALNEKMCWKCPALCPVYQSRLISVILIISSFLPAPSDRCVGAPCLQATPSTASRGRHHTDHPIPPPPGARGLLFSPRPRGVVWARSFQGPRARGRRGGRSPR